MRHPDLDALTLADVRAGVFDGRPVTVLGLARSGIALARFFADAGARVTVYDGRSEDELGRAIEQLGGRDVTLRLGPDVDPGTTWAGARPRRHLALDHARLPDHGAAPALAAAGARRRTRRRRPVRPAAGL